MKIKKFQEKLTLNKVTVSQLGDAKGGYHEETKLTYCNGCGYTNGTCAQNSQCNCETVYHTQCSPCFTWGDTCGVETQCFCEW